MCGHGSESSRGSGFGKSDLCWDGRELFRITKQRVKRLGRRKMLLGLVVLKIKLGR